MQVWNTVLCKPEYWLDRVELVRSDFISLITEDRISSKYCWCWTGSLLKRNKSFTVVISCYNLRFNWYLSYICSILVSNLVCISENQSEIKETCFHFQRIACSVIHRSKFLFDHLYHISYCWKISKFMTLMRRFRIELGRSSNLQNCRIYDGNKQISK